MKDKILKALERANTVTMTDADGVCYADFVATVTDEPFPPDELLIAFGDHTHISLKDLDRAKPGKLPHEFRLKGAVFGLHKLEPIQISMA